MTGSVLSVMEPSLPFMKRHPELSMLSCFPLAKPHPSKILGDQEGSILPSHLGNILGFG